MYKSTKITNNTSSTSSLNSSKIMHSKKNSRRNKYRCGFAPWVIEQQIQLNTITIRLCSNVAYSKHFNFFIKCLIYNLEHVPLRKKLSSGIPPGSHSNPGVGFSQVPLSDEEDMFNPPQGSARKFSTKSPVQAMR